MELIRTSLRWLAVIFFVVAGTLHFLWPDLYIRIMPRYFRFPEFWVAISGVAEIAGGVGLLIRPFRRTAGWGLIALLFAVLPANISMLQHSGEIHIAVWLLWVRLPLQGVIIAWVWFVAIRQSNQTQILSGVPH